jgi:hypothetical protein
VINGNASDSFGCGTTVGNLIAGEVQDHVNRRRGGESGQVVKHNGVHVRERQDALEGLTLGWRLLRLGRRAAGVRHRNCDNQSSQKKRQKRQRAHVVSIRWAGSALALRLLQNRTAGAEWNCAAAGADDERIGTWNGKAMKARGGGGVATREFWFNYITNEKKEAEGGQRVEL